MSVVCSSAFRVYIHFMHFCYKDIDFVQDIMAASTATREWFTKDILLTKALLDCMEAVGDGDGNVLKLLKEKFSPSGKNSQSSGSHGGGRTINALGSAAPTATVQDLVHLPELRLYHLKVQTGVHCKEDYKPLRADCVAKLQPLKDLLAAHKKRLAGIDSRRKAWKDVKDQKFGQLSSPTVFPIVLKCG